MVGWGSVAGLAGSNGPVFKSQRIAKVAPAMTSSRSRAIVQPQIFIRRRFRRSRSSHVSLASESEFVVDSDLDRGTYVCLSGGGFDEAVDVDCESETVAFSSSRCTAVENRFQNTGSRTPAMTIPWGKTSFSMRLLRRWRKICWSVHRRGMVCADVC